MACVEKKTIGRTSNGRNIDTMADGDVKSGIHVWALCERTATRMTIRIYGPSMQWYGPVRGSRFAPIGPKGEDK